jgi:hypothetical protein
VKVVLLAPVAAPVTVVVVDKVLVITGDPALSVVALVLTAV